MGRRAGRGWVDFFQRPSICGCAGGETKINGPRGGPWAGIFLSKTLELQVCWGRNQDQWAEYQAAGGDILFSDSQFARLGGGGTINGPKGGPWAGVFLSETLDLRVCWGGTKTNRPKGGLRASVFLSESLNLRVC